MEMMIVEVIRLHPEYQALIDAGEATLDADYSVEMGQSNPFLHMGMHIAIREQLSVDRPNGIVLLHQQLLAKLGDVHETEHRIMECLGESLWLAQRQGQAPDESAYLDCVQKLI